MSVEQRDGFLDNVSSRSGVSIEELKRYIAPETLEKIYETNREFLSAMTCMTRTCEKLRNVRLLPATVTTITITGKLSFDDTIDKELPIEFIRESITDTNEYDLYIGIQKKKKKRTGVFTKKVEHDKRKFRHQVSINHEGKSAKLFYNGSVHATGCTSLVDFIVMTTYITKFISDITSKDLILVLSDFKINMINTSSLVTNFRNYPLLYPPKTLTELMRQDNVNVDFDPERHPGVKIVLLEDSNKISTGCIFQTGSITIIGSKAPRHVADMFSKIAENLEKFWTISSSSVKLRTTTARKPLDLVHGYLSNSYNLCL